MLLVDGNRLSGRLVTSVSANPASRQSRAAPRSRSSLAMALRLRILRSCGRLATPVDVGQVPIAVRRHTWSRSLSIGVGLVLELEPVAGQRLGGMDLLGPANRRGPPLSSHGFVKEEEMGQPHRPAVSDELARPGAWGRSDGVLFALGPVTLGVIAIQFALAGFGAFTMDKTPTDNAYGAHVVLGLGTAVLTLLILAAVLASRSARSHSRTLWAAVTLVVLAAPVQPVLGEAGKSVPAVGALHGLNGLIIFVLVGLLTVITTRRRAASQANRTPNPSPSERSFGSQANEQ